MAEQRHFRLIIAGENPEQLIKEYDNKKEVEKYCVFKFSDAEKIRKSTLADLKKAIDKFPEDSDKRAFLQEEYDYYSSMDEIEFYTDITEGYDIDEETGNAYSTSNPNGKYDSAQPGGQFALPLITKDGKEVYACKKGDVDWPKVHLTGTEAYEAAWDMVMEGKKPVTDDEKIIYENMKNRKLYFEHFKTRENYIKSNTAFWGYAFLSKKTGWVELEHHINQYDWVVNFYDRFIVPLDDNELISVYECYRELGV